MLIAFASEKGGAGKTTLAALLAAQLHARGAAFRLCDGDRQQSLAALAEVADDLPAAEEVYPTGFARLRGEGLTLLDLPSGAGVELHTALAVADLVLVPAAPSAFDLRTLPTTLSHVRRAQDLRDGLPRALIVPNKVCLRETLAQELQALLEEIGWPVTRTWLRERAVYRRMGAAGLAALAKQSRRPAEVEAAALTDEVLAFAEEVRAERREAA